MGNRVAKGRKKEDDLFIMNVLRKEHPPLSFHDSPSVRSHQASVREQAAIIAQASDLLLQACGLVPSQSPTHSTQLSAFTHHGRGRPQRVCWTQLWSSLRLGALQGMKSFADWRRLLGLLHPRDAQRNDESRERWPVMWFEDPLPSWTSNDQARFTGSQRSQRVRESSQSQAMRRPRAVAKVSGIQKSLIETSGAVFERALRAKHSAQERR
jgi:hypothetical protein